ncbi:Ig-like domain-containing protein [Colwellia sp. D2M02]|uniref:Ig-like domain-containing protein n=1 Tax=Colwellia sp. D2M02 TaxID=2841562 RepID=UPI001C098B3A|nr:Ig-like domain-containing protein [Colwellia sp. D2M02]MBU2891906.1 Ig-like domain-containing protein [Colwellia sp. D2M02]
MQRLRKLSFSLLLMSLMTLVACGGGDGDLTGGNDGGGTTSPDLETITIAISKSDGDLSGDNDITLTATVMQGTEAVASKLVTFELSDETLAVLENSAGTKSTDSSGVATMMVKATNLTGGINVTVSINDEDVAPVEIAFDSVGGGAGGSVGDPVADSITLFASSTQLASSGAQEITLTALAKDSEKLLLEGVNIRFSADSGSLEKVFDDNGDSSTVTGPDGKLTMKLSTLAEPENRIITVEVKSGSVSDVIEVEVVGTTVSLTGSSSLAIGDDNTYVIKVLDSDGDGIANTLVNLSLIDSTTNIDLPTSVTTDNTGQANITVKGTAGGSNTIVASALGAMASKKVSIQSDSFLFSSFSNGTSSVNPEVSEVPDVLLSKTASVTLTWNHLDAQSKLVPVPDGTVVKFSTTRGTLTTNSATTVNGKVTATLTSLNAGKSLVTFIGENGAIELTNQLEFEFVADTADTMIAQAFPKSIGPNGQTSTISVVVRDPSGNLVKNKKVGFVLTDTSGGEIFPDSAVTDSNGMASTVYTSKTVSKQNSIVITATVDNTNVTDSVELTVADRELFISLGTGNEIEELDTTSYVKEYSVFVTDADSNPVKDIDLTISAIPHKYYKGYWYPVYDGDDFIRWVPFGADDLEVSVGVNPPRTSFNLRPKQCSNEDLNLDGILDVGEDTNNNGRLTPGNVVSAQGNITTDEDGRAVVRITYAQSYGEWLDVKLIASTKVNGSESSVQTIFNLPVFAEDVNQEKVSPPTQGIGLRGPFGLLNTCELNISQDPNLDGS